MVRGYLVVLGALAMASGCRSDFDSSDDADTTGSATSGAGTGGDDGGGTGPDGSDDGGSDGSGTSETSGGAGGSTGDGGTSTGDDGTTSGDGGTSSGDGGTSSDDGGSSSGETSSDATSGPGTTSDATSSSDPATTGGDTSSDDPPESSCNQTYHDWFESSFSYPDGGVVGTADFPSSPWGAVSGAPTIDSGRLVTVGQSTLIASQGGVLPSTGLRLRFRVTFNDSDNETTIGIDADATGDPRLGVTLQASDGTFAVFDGGSTAASTVLGALELDTQYFVEIETPGSTGTAWLSKTNYATVPGADVVATLPLTGITASANGKYVTAQLAASGGGSPEVDDLRVSRCGSQPPDYDQVFVDAFERSSLGNADLPATSAWNDHGSGAYVGGGSLRLIDFTLGPRCEAQRAIGNTDARLRAVVSFGDSNAWPGIEWGVAGTPQAGGSDLGFILWNNGPDGHVILRGYGGGYEEAFPGQTFATNTDYYVEVSLDGSFGVATVRTSSFSGPVYVATATDDITSPPGMNDEVGISNSGGGTLYIREMELAQYSAP